ncbi:MAG: hypothetical protein JSV69_15200 [Chloroflexota bacterium]|nr:MAG: hypothetical protein JSV69_15200 [Chloroflexota bacterium]
MKSPPKQYAIKLKEHLEPDWSDWFDGFFIEEEDNFTLLKGEVIDQAELHGFLIMIRDLGLTLISVEELNDLPDISTRGSE